MARVADPHHIDADPDQAFHFDAGPDLASQNDADTDPDPQHWLAKLYFHLFTINASPLLPLRFKFLFFNKFNVTIRLSLCKIKWNSIFKKIFLLNNKSLVGETEI